MIIVCKAFLMKGYNAVTLFPFIILRHQELKENVILINHERIHLKQQLELLIIGFYLWYILEFLWHYIKHRNWKTAYYAISFEREAYANEQDFKYLKERPFFAFLNYK